MISFLPLPQVEPPVTEIVEVGDGRICTIAATGLWSIAEGSRELVMATPPFGTRLAQRSGALVVVGEQGVQQEGAEISAASMPNIRQAAVVATDNWLAIAGGTYSSPWRASSDLHVYGNGEWTSTQLPEPAPYPFAARFGKGLVLGWAGSGDVVFWSPSKGLEMFCSIGSFQGVKTEFQAGSASTDRLYLLLARTVEGDGFALSKAVAAFDGDSEPAGLHALPHPVPAIPRQAGAIAPLGQGAVIAGDGTIPTQILWGDRVHSRPDLPHLTHVVPSRDGVIGADRTGAMWKLYLA